MLICDNGIIREMTAEEETMGENLPNPEDIISEEEAFKILMGEQDGE